MRCELHNGDCLEVMKRIPDHSVDMVLCDLPYGTTACKWDVVIPFAPLWEQYGRVCKENAAIVLFASQPFTSMLVMSNLKMFRHEWIWIKSRGSNFANTVREPFKEHEEILVFSKGGWTYNKQMQNRTGSGAERVKYDIAWKSKSDNYREFSERIGKKDPKERVPSSWQKFTNEVGLHPTQKPVALLSYLIKTYTNGGGRQFWTTAWVRGRRVSLAWRRRGTSSASRRTRSILPSRKTALPNAAPKAFSNLCLRKGQ